MQDPKIFFHGIPGGRVLDVATGSGSFIHFLIDTLPAIEEIVGLDSNERAAVAFNASFADKPFIRFQQGDALHAPFPEASFDTVCIANSLHHFDDPGSVLVEMLRVLRPGGFLIFSEMYADEQSETQQTHVLLHHWWAAIDRINGVIHHPTFTRQALATWIENLGLDDLQIDDYADTTSDPLDPAILQELTPVFERYIQRAAGNHDLQQQGHDLRRRVETIGFHSATSLLARGIKPAQKDQP